MGELKCKRVGPHEITELPSNKSGRPLLLGEEVDRKVKAYLLSLCSCGAVLNKVITLTCAKGIVMNEDASSLDVSGGHISLTKHWVKNFLRRIGFIKRKGTPKARVGIENFKLLKEQLLFDIKCIVDIREIPPTLIINWDQPVSIMFLWLHGPWKRKEASESKLLG